MRPIFSVHAGEYLVGMHIQENYKNLNVWIPAKDTGIDILLTDKTNRKTLSIQVKFSKDYLGSLGKTKSEVVSAKVRSGGWWKFSRKKIAGSAADLWILVLYRFTRRDYDFIIIQPQDLLERYNKLERNDESIQSYIWVTSSNRCWETRGLKKQEEDAVALDKYTDPIRDLTCYLNNWEIVKERLL